MNQSESISIAPAADEWTSSNESPALVIPRSLQGKRVAMVVFSYYTADPRPRRAAEFFAKCGMSVDVICLRQHGKDPKSETLNGVNIRRLPITRKREGVFGYFYQYSAFIFISSAILALRTLTARYHLVYVNNMPDVLVLSGLIPKLLGARIILDLHDPMPELMVTIFNLPQDARQVRILTFLERWSMWLADSVVTVNSAFARLFESRSCAPEKITVIMNSPDETIFRLVPAAPPSKNAIHDRPFVIMYHGSLVKRNGLQLAVDAFARVKKTVPRAELRIYGASNPFMEGVLADVRSQGLEGVRYLGPKSLEEIVEAIAQCDVGIVPNERNIFTELNTPTRILEYLALGKPVIAPRSAGICDYFAEDSVIFFELGDAEDLARKMEFVFDRPDIAASTAQRGQEVHQSHSWRRQQLRLLDLVTGLLSTSRRGASPAS